MAVSFFKIVGKKSCLGNVRLQMSKVNVMFRFQDLTLNAMHSVNVAQLQICFDDGVRRIGKN